MRVNKYIAQATGLSRRAVDAAIKDRRVSVNGLPASAGQQIAASDIVTLDKRPITPDVKTVTLILNKPIGYVVSRDGQGSQTIYDLLPPEYHGLKPVGRLDKDSSGLLLLTNDGQLAHQLTHPSFQKEKVYEVVLDKPLESKDRSDIESGIELEDGVSRLSLSGEGAAWIVTMNEGRNRQIRRTFAARGYTVTKLHRIQFGPYKLNNLPLEKFTIL
ncbi:MAG TPA: pseudouridine synthase [Candidatus Saccharimonadales bacterium]|nr:pseudouridine synthase [Candidatus Saccharimonadales bacterium]